MVEPGRPNALNDFWKMGEVSLGQMRTFAESLGMTLPPLPNGVGPADPQLAETTRQFQDLMDACLKLTSEVASHAGSSPSDAVTAELLRKILDPREWLQSTGFMDDATRRLTEVPKLADLWQVEGKYLALMRAWSETRAIGVEHSAHLLREWAMAASEFTAALKEDLERGEKISRRDLINRWVEIANGHLIAVQGSEPYLETQRKLLKATTDLRMAQRDLTEFYSETFGFPTRAELDDLARMFAELRREVRGHRILRHSLD